MPMYRKLTTAAAVAALTLGLAACGGGGSDEPTATAPPPTTTPDPMPPAPTPVAVTVPDAMYLDAANMPMAGPPITIAAGATETSGGVTFLCAAGGEACEVTVADDGSVTATGGTVTASLTAAAMAQVATAKEMKSDEMLAMRDRIIGEDSAIEGATPLSNSGVASTTPQTANTLDARDILISRGPGAMPRVRVGTDQPGFIPAAESAMANGDWAGTRLSRPATGGSETLVVYTDIEAPKRAQFYDFDGDAETPAVYTTPAGGTTAGLTISGATPNIFTGANLDPNKFPSKSEALSGGVKVEEFKANAETDDDATNGFDTISFRGNFDGAPGTYACDSGTQGGSCVVTVTATGSYSSTGTWTFTPEDNAQAWRDDSEFMSFGWWLREPLSANGTYSYRYYYDGAPYAVNGAPIGTATYSGRAAGRYVVQETGTEGVTGGESGEFTAAATLSANFSAQPVATIEGSISNFQGAMDMSAWEVTLHRKSLVGDNRAGLALAFPNAQSDPTAPRFDGTTATMGDQTAYGTWTGQFIANARHYDPTTSTRVPTADAHPLAVGGTFIADNESVSIAGAFGARRPK